MLDVGVFMVFKRLEFFIRFKSIVVGCEEIERTVNGGGGGWMEHGWRKRGERGRLLNRGGI